MAFPKTFEELKAQGYKFSNDATCRGCGADIEWYETPSGSKMPFDSMTSASSPSTSHFATCPNASDFKRGR